MLNLCCTQYTVQVSVVSKHLSKLEALCYVSQYIDSLCTLTQPQNQRFAHFRLTWTTYSIYSQLTTIYINTKIPPQFSPSNFVQILPLCSHANANITAETKHIKRLTSFSCCVLKLVHVPSPYF